MVIAPSHPRARTVALIGRNGAGKTSLLEALVVATGGLERPGRVDAGTSLCGNDPEERRHQMSLGIAMAPVWVGEDKLTLLDTPGLIDFSGEVERALDVADVAVLVVSAVDGVQADFVSTWNLAQEAGVPVVIFVNALDAERANFESTLRGLELLVGPTLAPLELPIGEGATFQGVVDLLADVAITYDARGSRRGPVPTELADLEARVRSSLLEAIVVADDTLTERYLEGDIPTMEELEPALSELMIEGRIVPVTCGSATRGLGVDRLATLLDEIAISRPIPALAGGNQILLERDPHGDPIMRAFKVIVDPYVGRIVVMEVISGTITNDIVLTNTRTRSEERLHGLHHLFGSKLVPVDRAVTGDVVAVGKLNDVVAGDILAKKGLNISPVPAPTATPAMSVALASSSRDDDDKIATALHRLSEEDPSLRIRHDPVSRKLVVDVMGDTHLQVTLERLRRRFNVDVATATPDVQLFETIVAPRECEGRLKKQTGGHGQFAVVNLKVEPIEPDAAFEFVDAVVGGAVPRQFISAVRHGIEKAMNHGGPKGHQVVGLRVTLLDGKFHSVDSSEAAFDTAGSIGLKAALESAGTNVLERVMEVTATFPTQYLGEVLNDLKPRRGRVVRTDQSEAANVTLVAYVPEAGLNRYGLDLRAITAGRAHVSIVQHHLAAVA
jgi:elongation factor G